MQQEQPQGENDNGAEPANEGETRPQRGGDAETTRFGTEPGDNTDVPATGGPPENVAAD